MFESSKAVAIGVHEGIKFALYGTSAFHDFGHHDRSDIRLMDDE